MTRRNRRAWPVAVVLAPLALAACQSTARQDPLYVRSSTDAMVFQSTALFRDRPLNESLLSSLELTDYAAVLDRTGLLTELRRPGPYTVFAIPNEPLEAARLPGVGQAIDPAALPSLRRTLAYTIVPGHYTEAQLRQMIARQRGAIGLRTLDGDVLTVSQEAATGQLVLSDAQGRVNRIWLADMPQSNGVLYATQSMLTPGTPAAPAVR